MPEEAVQQLPAESPEQEAMEPSAESAPAESETQTSTEGEQQTEQQQAAPPKRGGGVQRRIDELVRKAYLAEAEAEFWRKKAMGAQGTPSSTPPKPPAEPKPADFETTEEYLAAVRAWDREQLKAELDKRLEDFDRRQKQQAEAEALAAEWAEREAEAAGKRTDYASVASAAVEALRESHGPAVAAIAHAIQFSDAGPELLYYLGQHPEEISDLADLHPTQAVIALGRLEARLTESPAAKAEPQQTQAPRPITPVRGTSATGALRPDHPDSDKMTDEEWLKARQAQLRERARR